MDRSLDDSIQERQQLNPRASRDRRPPRDGIRKSYRREDNLNNLDRDWVHDKYDDESDSRRPYREAHPVRMTRRDPIDQSTNLGVKVKVDNVHYDLTEEDLRELFERIGPTRSVTLVYDRSDRSTGVAYVVYPDGRDARAAMQEFDGANANGQPIRLSIVPSAARAPRNPFDNVERPSRSLFDRIERRPAAESDDERSGGRRSNVTRPAPEHIDRYVPDQSNGGGRDDRNNSRRRSPRRDGRGAGGRRPGQRRQPPKDTEGHQIVGGRPRNTAEELDAEMDDYWGGGAPANGDAKDNGNEAAVPDVDIDMDI